MYLIYTDSNKKYKCTAENENNNISVTFEGEFEAGTNGFCLYLDSGKLLGDYTNYKNIVESKSDGFTFSKTAAEDVTVEEKTLGQKLEETQEQVKHLEELLYITNEALEELIFDMCTTEEDETT